MIDARRDRTVRGGIAERDIELAGARVSSAASVVDDPRVVKLRFDASSR